jgi:hypothetical protein
MPLLELSFVRTGPPGHGSLSYLLTVNLYIKEHELFHCEAKPRYSSFDIHGIRIKSSINLRILNLVSPHPNQPAKHIKSFPNKPSQNTATAP